MHQSVAILFYHLGSHQHCFQLIVPQLSDVLSNTQIWKAFSDMKGVLFSISIQACSNQGCFNYCHHPPPPLPVIKCFTKRLCPFPQTNVNTVISIRTSYLLSDQPLNILKWSLRKAAWTEFWLLEYQIINFKSSLLSSN